MTETATDTNPDTNNWPARHQHHGGYWLAIIFITVGVLLLLQNFNLVQPAIWNEISKFWPILIIMIGLEIIFGKSAAGRLLMILVTLLIILAILVAVNLLPTTLIPPQLGLY